METVLIIVILGLIYIAILLMIILGVKTIIETYRTYYMVLNHEKHMELKGIVSDVKYPGNSRYSTEYVEVEFEYEGKKCKKRTRYNFAKYYKMGDEVTICLLPEDEKKNIVIKSDESQSGMLNFMAGGLLVIGGILMAILMTYSFLVKGVSF